MISKVMLFLQNISAEKGIICLHLNYCNIMETIVNEFVEEFNCTHVFSGGACGFIPTTDYHPEIGSRISITKSMSYNGEIIEIAPNNNLHLQIPSIFLETYEWFETVKKIPTSCLTIDVETFYILRALQKYQNIIIDCGCFVSDYVGEQPLIEYSRVFVNYESSLSKFLDNIIN